MPKDRTTAMLSLGDQQYLSNINKFLEENPDVASRPPIAAAPGAVEVGGKSGPSPTSANAARKMLFNWTQNPTPPKEASPFGAGPYVAGATYPRISEKTREKHKEMAAPVTAAPEAPGAPSKAAEASVAVDAQVDAQETVTRDVPPSKDSKKALGAARRAAKERELARKAEGDEGPMGGMSAVGLMGEKRKTRQEEFRARDKIARQVSMLGDTIGGTTVATSFIKGALKGLGASMAIKSSQDQLAETRRLRAEGKANDEHPISRLEAEKQERVRELEEFAMVENLQSMGTGAAAGPIDALGVEPPY